MATSSNGRAKGERQRRSVRAITTTIATPAGVGGSTGGQFGGQFPQDRAAIPGRRSVPALRCALLGRTQSGNRGSSRRSQVEGSHAITARNHLPAWGQLGEGVGVQQLHPGFRGGHLHPRGQADPCGRQRQAHTHARKSYQQCDN